MAGPVLMGIILTWGTFSINNERKLLNKKNVLWERLIPTWKITNPISIISWFSLWPGLILLGVFGIVPDQSAVYILSILSLLTFVLTIISARAYDNLTLWESAKE